jgi:hypothetical protein
VQPDPSVARSLTSLRIYLIEAAKKGRFTMDSTTLIRIVSGLLFVVVLVVLVQRRRTKVN